MFIDTHCHLNFQKFNEDLDDVVKRALDADVEKIVIPGAKLDSSERAVEIASQYDSCYAAVGIHPHHSAELTDHGKEIIRSRLKALAASKKTVAIGEIGIDYHEYKDYPPLTPQDIQLQKELLFMQLDLAIELNLPVILHCRDAHDDFLPLLKEYLRNNPLRGVFHCFGGNKTHLEEILSMGCYVGFDGNTTYKANHELRELIRLTPLDRLFLETDAPYLTPEPHRGIRNEPSYIPLIAQLVADMHGKTIDEIAQITSHNATELFRF